MKVYHGSENKFSEFNFENVGKNALYAGYGYYFSSSKIYASAYATGDDSTLFGYDVFFDNKKYTFDPVLYSGNTDLFHGWWNYCFHINFDDKNFNYKNHFIDWCKYGLESSKGKHKKALNNFYKEVLKTQNIKVKIPKYLYSVNIETSKIYNILTKPVANLIIQQLKREKKYTKEIELKVFSLIGTEIFTENRISKLKDILIEHIYNYIVPISENIGFISDKQILIKNQNERKISMFFYRCGINGFFFKVPDVYNYYTKNEETNIEFVLFDKKSILNFKKI